VEVGPEGVGVGDRERREAKSRELTLESPFRSWMEVSQERRRSLMEGDWAETEETEAREKKMKSKIITEYLR